MNKAKINENWDEQKRKLKQKFAALNENDLLFVKGKKEEMMENLQKILGKTKEELNLIIEGL
ncbi:general stress protein CsbD [Flavobacterium sp. K5-23]|uniref:CsbD family protein n=1 Tax=Flavobacterium sp. K5-23 TaxID=2746225 RepID=UPI00200DD066|nr:general stress protein CsbD [Flavobacterium sp. K5-23]UQD56677.1 general stress protein CsbD [Flavobacterium sp. K5-23]